MSCDFTALAVSGVRDLNPYVPGKPVSELKRELGLKRISKLASNENPLGPAPAAADAAIAALTKEDIARYPDPTGFELKKTLSEFYNVDFNNITLGNGSDNLIDLLVQAFVNPGEEVIISEYAFAVYALAAKQIGAKVTSVAAEGYAHNLAAMAAAVTDKTKMIFIANPNNPTGTWANKKQMQQFLQQVPENVIVVVDEAYAEYINNPDYPNSLELQRQHQNLVVLRTFSKAYGLAALRVGYAIADVKITDFLNRIRRAFNVNHPAQQAAVAAVLHQQHIQQSLQFNQQQKQLLENKLKCIGVKFIESTFGNFVTINLEQPARPIFEQLLKKGVIVRPLANYDMPYHLRVSVGLPEENEHFMAALIDVLQ